MIPKQTALPYLRRACSGVATVDASVGNCQRSQRLWKGLLGGLMLEAQHLFVSVWDEPLSASEVAKGPSVCV